LGLGRGRTGRGIRMEAGRAMSNICLKQLFDFVKRKNAGTLFGLQSFRRARTRAADPYRVNLPDDLAADEAVRGRKCAAVSLAAIGLSRRPLRPLSRDGFVKKNAAKMRTLFTRMPNRTFRNERNVGHKPPQNSHSVQNSPHDRNLNLEWTYWSSIRTWSGVDIVECKRAGPAVFLRRGVQPHGIHRPGERLDGLLLRHAEPADISCSTVGLLT